MDSFCKTSLNVEESILFNMTSKEYVFSGGIWKAEKVKGNVTNYWKKSMRRDFHFKKCVPGSEQTKV